MTKKLIASGAFGQSFRTIPDSGGPILQVSPFTVITFASDTTVHTYVILKATLKTSPSGSVVWSTRYISSTGAPLPLAGNNSLTANGGQPLKNLLALDLEHAVNFMLQDVAKQTPRNKGKQVYVESAVPYLRGRRGLVGYELADEGTTLVFAPTLADASVVAGVYVLDKSEIKYRSATRDDENISLDDDK